MFKSVGREKVRWEKKVKNKHPGLRSMSQEVTEMFPGIKSACLFVFSLKVLQSGDSVLSGS